MSREYVVAKTTITRRGVLDVKGFYLFLWDFITSILGYSFNEDDYFHTKKESTEDIEFHWTFLLPKDSYTTFRIWIECKVRNAKKVKVKSGEDNVSRFDGEIEVGIKGVMILDADNTWKNNGFLRNFQKVYEQFFYKSNIEDYEDRLWEHLFTVGGEVKSFFGLVKFI